MGFGTNDQGGISDTGTPPEIRYNNGRLLLLGELPVPTVFSWAQRRMMQSYPCDISHGTRSKQCGGGGGEASHITSGPSNCHDDPVTVAKEASYSGQCSKMSELLDD